MSKYQLQNLSPFDFEQLAGDLLSRELGCELHQYTSGRDNGIDLAHQAPDGGWTIVQCKHYAGSTKSALLRDIKNKEVPKVQALAPARYILVTSLPVTPGVAKELHSLLKPYCRSASDVIGADQLIKLLRKHPEVEKTNFKLWLSSTAVLERLLHSDLYTQAQIAYEAAIRKLRLYVDTPASKRCWETLKQEHSCVISGAPGIGKTTLAEILLVQAVADGWQPVVVRNNIREALSLYSAAPAAKQLFYYDDFLGQFAFGEKLGKNEDHAIAQLMSAVQRSTNKYFLLTTREYILRQAESNYEPLKRMSIDLSKCIVSLDDYSLGARAKILYNHLYFNGVDLERIARLVDDGTHLKIVSHRNFNPRLIDWMTHLGRVKRWQPDEYSGACLRALNEPKEVWQDAFESQISPTARDCLIGIASIGPRAPKAEAEQAYWSIQEVRRRRYGSATSSSSFLSSLKELDGTLARSEADDNLIFLAVHDPSVLDFIGVYLREHPNELRDLLESAVYFEQAARVWLLTGPTDTPAAPEQTADLCLAAGLRTLKGESATYYRLRITEDKTRWERSRNQTATRLSTLVKIGQYSTTSSLRRRIASEIAAYANEAASSYVASLHETIQLAEDCEENPWIKAYKDPHWDQNLISAFLGSQPNTDESITFARWYVERFPKQPRPQWGKVVECVESGIQSWIDNFDEEVDSDAVGDVISELESLEEILSISLKSLKAELEDLPSGERPSRRSSSRLPQASSKTAQDVPMTRDQIDHMFRGLLKK